MNKEPQKRKVKIGVLGGFRGMTMIDWCVRNPDRAEVVAICDFSEHAQKSVREFLGREHYRTTLYGDFEQFLCHDMDLVISFLSLYLLVLKQDIKRINYIKNHANDDVIYLYFLPHGEYVFFECLPAYMDKFKSFYGIEQSKEVKMVPYEDIKF